MPTNDGKGGGAEARASDAADFDDFDRALFGTPERKQRTLRQIEKRRQQKAAQAQAQADAERQQQQKQATDRDRQQSENLAAMFREIRARREQDPELQRRAQQVKSRIATLSAKRRLTRVERDELRQLQTIATLEGM